ncbi:Tripartite-type tricarboxylate transporter, receptor component TctC [Enhydrobacter aerosaccus]|uniref:Tripartite-type tricarboxylate transporter, receptor component TctC n=1 Tax=Enhydrobacter aerosaccus TaxID=225324 RepID=A0A1T4RJJ7_9HYPH|nr:tripartite tricarboxylate transporter substrate binding protein [Enhydrobacter aerosaccus]SKA15918.1 Tripartite-type tricarboxylate transporter, receptor component TctC [Enhydrobacter aerosaccus]
MKQTRRAVLRGLAGVTVAGPVVAAPFIARAEAMWPAKPVTIVVNFPAGGLTDGIARAFGQAVQQATGQQVIIDNRPGASGNIGAAQVARANGDGYTFLHTVSSTLVQNRAMFKNLGFDPDKDFVLVSGMSSGVLPVVVHKSVPVTNLKELVAYAKTNKVNFGSWALGSSAHILAQHLNEKFGLSMEIVTYKGEAPMWQDMGAGSLQAAMGSPQAMNALLVKGEIRPIAAPSRVRAGKLPDVPTTIEQGFTDDAFVVRGWLGLAAPAGTPKEVVKRMSDLWVAAADSEPGRRMMESFGLTEKPMPHEEVTADYETLKASLIPMIVALGIKPE